MENFNRIFSLSGFITLLENIYGYAPLIPSAADPSIADPAANFIIALCGGVLLGLGLDLF